MLTISTGDPRFDCRGIARRDVLRIGALGLGAWTLPGLLRARAEAAALGGSLENRSEEKSVVLLFLAGGASHIETFDPHIDAPRGTRSTTGEVPTTIPGVTFGGNFPKLARLADRMAIVRSFQHRTTDHARAIREVITAGNELEAGMGALYARLRGATNPETGLPTSALVSTEEVDRQYRKERQRIAVGASPGKLSKAYAPFDPAGGSESLDNMRLHVPEERLLGRRRLLRALDGVRREIDAKGAPGVVDRYREQAIDLILRGANDALDLEREDPRVLERYDTSGHRVGHKTFRACTLGRQMLMARRLCEAGCGFVTVQNCGWDMHADGNNPGIVKGMNMLGTPLDHAVSAFLEDVEERGLSDKILLVITGDFGRTPKVNKRGGRDHWSRLSTLALAGGGLPMGQVIGASSPKADVPSTEPVTLRHLLGTVLDVLFDLGELRLVRGIPPEIARMVEGADTIPGLG